jgi:uncharacterized protein
MKATIDPTERRALHTAALGTQSALVIRRVELDFSDANVRWCPKAPEYAHLLNAISSFVPHLEAFLVKAVRAAAAQLPADAAPELRRDAERFAMQEARHSKQHLRFNRRMHECGFDWLEPHEAGMKADFQRFLDVKGLRFSLAYSEGFETFGPLVARFFFENGADLMAGADDVAVDMWLWHFAEEYEHRDVCNYLYAELYGSYRARVYGLWYAAIHLFGYAARMAWKMIDADLDAGVLRGRWRTRARFARVLARLFANLVPTLVVRCMRPSYDPHLIAPPAGVVAYLDTMRATYGTLDR